MLIVFFIACMVIGISACSTSPSAPSPSNPDSGDSSTWAVVDPYNIVTSLKVDNIETKEGSLFKNPISRIKGKTSNVYIEIAISKKLSSVTCVLELSASGQSITGVMSADKMKYTITLEPNVLSDLKSIQLSIVPDGNE